jgi:hypothetical protein
MTGLTARHTTVTAVSKLYYTVQSCLRPNLFIMPAKGGLKMETIRYISNRHILKGGRIFKKEPAEEVFV